MDANMRKEIIRMKMPVLFSQEIGKSVDVDFIIKESSSILAVSMIGKLHNIAEMRGTFKKWGQYALKDRLSDKALRVYPYNGGAYRFSSSRQGDMVHCMGYHLDRLEDSIINWEGKPFPEILTSFLQEKKQLPVTQEIVERVLEVNAYEPLSYKRFYTELEVITSNPQYENLTAYMVNTENFITLMNSINLAGEYSEFDWDSIETMDDYIIKFLEPITAKVTENIQVLYNKSTPIPDVIFKGKKKPFSGQIPIIASCIEVLKNKNNKFCYLSSEQGTGKTLMSTLTSIGYFSEIGEKNPTIFVLCPATTIGQWREEIKSCCSNPFRVGIIEISDTNQFIRLYEKTKLKFDKPTYILCSKETFKLSYDRYPVYVSKTKELTYEVGDGKHANDFEVVTEKRSALFCTECGEPLILKNQKKGDIFLTPEDFKNKNSRNSKCPHCDNVLWAPLFKKTRKISVIDYIKARNIKFSLSIIDEMQESNNSQSLIGMGTSTLLRNHSSKALTLSGTPNNGYASSLYNIISAFLPRSLHKNKIFNLTDFIEAYGTLEAVYKSGDVEKNYNGEVVTKQSDFREVEGVNPLVFTKYLASNFVSATLTDLTKDLPPLNEHYIGIEPDYNLQCAENQFEAAISSARCLKTMGSSILRHYVNNPYNWGTLELGDNPFTPSNLDESVMSKKEEKLIELVKEELSEGRKCMIYVEFNDKGGKYLNGDTIPERLIKLFQKQGLRVFYLNTATCKGTERKEVLDRMKNQYDIFMTNRKLVSVGLNLQFIPTYINYIPSFMVNDIEQANRRGYRIDCKDENRIYHLYYQSVYEERAIQKYQRKKAESNAILGKFDVELEMESVRTASSFSKKINETIIADTELSSTDYVVKESIDIFARESTNYSEENTYSDVLFQDDSTSTPLESLMDFMSSTSATTKSEEVPTIVEPIIDTVIVKEETVIENTVIQQPIVETSDVPTTATTKIVSGQLTFDCFSNLVITKKKKPTVVAEAQVDLFSMF